MDITRCDRCHLDSPKDGLFVANNWIEVVVSDRGESSLSKEYIFCCSCFKAIKEEMSVLTY